MIEMRVHLSVRKTFKLRELLVSNGFAIILVDTHSGPIRLINEDYKSSEVIPFEDKIDEENHYYDCWYNDSSKPSDETLKALENGFFKENTVKLWRITYRKD